jgi:hypothetical protein
MKGLLSKELERYAPWLREWMINVILSKNKSIYMPVFVLLKLCLFFFYKFMELSGRSRTKVFLVNFLWENAKLYCSGGTVLSFLFCFIHGINPKLVFFTIAVLHDYNLRDGGWGEGVIVLMKPKSSLFSTAILYHLS